MPFHRARDWEVHIYDPEAIQVEAVVALPADPLEFLADCAAWWAWLASAEPDEIERDPQHGHRPERWELASEEVIQETAGLLRVQRRWRSRGVYRETVEHHFTDGSPPVKPSFPPPRIIGEAGPELIVPEGFQLGMGVYGPLGKGRRPTTPKPPLDPKGQGRREPNPPPREP
jgi:hypothetical protein